jgi:Helix-turn-helix domain
MTIQVQEGDRIAMSQRERDVLKVLQSVIDGKRTQAEAARLLDLSGRQVRRLQRKLEAQGDGCLVHGLRGRASNHGYDAAFRTKVLLAYQRRYSDFGPTLASEKLAEEKLTVCPETLRCWLLDAGLWQRQRKRDPHRSRRPRRSCFGELVQMDASIHDWLEGRGEEVLLIGMIDDATNHVEARFYPAGTVETHMDLLGIWLRRHGRPRALYTDRHSIFEPQDKGKALPDGVTQFGRALSELQIELIRARSPQAKGRVERLFGTAQDRWVKELRLAKAKTCAQANDVLKQLVPEHNRRFGRRPREITDAHRVLGPEHQLKAILSIQEQRVVSNDYTIRYKNRFYQLLKPVYPGERGGQVVIEERLDGVMAIRYRGHYLKYQEIEASKLEQDAGESELEFSASTADASATKRDRDSQKKSRSPGIQPTGGRSGRTPAEPYPPDGDGADNPKPTPRPAENHPWRKKLL